MTGSSVTGGPGWSPAERPDRGVQLTMGERFAPLGLMVAVMWVVEIADRVLPWNLEAHGIHPRQWGGLTGILWAPFLHAGWGHLIANTGPLLVLGGLLVLRGLGRWLAVTVLVALVGGLITWLIGTGGDHIGASGLVFGYFGALVAGAVFERRPGPAILALVAMGLYWTILFGLLPHPGISWAGHLGGLTAGIGAARVLASSGRRPRPVLPA